MNGFGCGEAREAIGARAAGALEAPESGALDAHLRSCAECAAEAELVTMLRQTRPEPPAGLADEIVLAVRRDRRATRSGWWGLSAAAVAVLAVGLGSMSHRDVTPVHVPVYAVDAGAGELWLSEDGLVAGAPSFDGLSDEALEELLDELAAGGAA